MTTGSRRQQASCQRGSIPEGLISAEKTWPRVPDNDIYVVLSAMYYKTVIVVVVSGSLALYPATTCAYP